MNQAEFTYCNFYKKSAALDFKSTKYEAVYKNDRDGIYESVGHPIGIHIT